MMSQSNNSRVVTSHNSHNLTDRKQESTHDVTEQQQQPRSDVTQPHQKGRISASKNRLQQHSILCSFSSTSKRTEP